MKQPCCGAPEGTHMANCLGEAYSKSQASITYAEAARMVDGLLDGKPGMPKKIIDALTARPKVSMSRILAMTNGSNRNELTEALQAQGFEVIE